MDIVQSKESHGNELPTSDSSSDDGGEVLTAEYLKEKKNLDRMLEDASDPEDYSDDEEEEIDCEKELAGIVREIPAGSRIESLGQVHAIMKPFIVLTTRSTFAVLDIGSLVVCSNSRTVAGIIWDVFGPIKAPLYSVLVRPELLETFVKGTTLSFCPDHIKLVSKDALLQDRGADRDPNAPEDFSDDEEERLHRKGLETGEIS